MPSPELSNPAGENLLEKCRLLWYNTPTKWSYETIHFARGGANLMARKKESRATKPRCDNCCFSTFATGTGQTTLICRQKKGSEGKWNIRPLRGRCASFYPSRAAGAKSRAPRRIPLTRGKFAIVDAEDYPRLSQYTWFAEGTDKNCYAVRKENGKSIKMHREIMNAPDHLVVDHIDHNGLNNRKENLRVCTFAENCRNIKGRSLNYGRNGRKTSKYKGVHRNKRIKKWAAQITCDNKTYHLGYFTDETAAAKAYDKAAKKYHRKFASLNFTKGKKADSP